ncbi:hypothetical protein E2562_017931 [Oryza meyeriana var. granulata]|uniref:NAC domain-containing protein n=1 Tax=Oryza meyeriana var. granulata TaxID=110450 RepID=A0A6G1CSH4_9ORYZ|nr:hypothetical protein E2562_017931 [Oryza meyeriana var. granulata]
MHEHGHDASAHAFFVHDRPGSGRRDRVVKNGGGVWRLQKSEEATLTILRDGGGGELDVAYKRRNLSFHRASERASTGVKDKRSDVKEEPAASGESTGGDYNNGYIAGGHQLAVTEPDELGPIKQCCCADFNIYCNDAGAGDSANHYNAGSSNGSYSYYGGDNNNYGHNNGVPYNSDKPGPSHQYHYGGQVASNGFLTDGDVR